MNRAIVITFTAAFSASAIAGCSLNVTGDGVGDSVKATAAAAAPRSETTVQVSEVPDKEIAVSNVDKSSRLAAGGKVTITAQGGWTLGSVEISGAGAMQSQPVTSPSRWTSAPLEPGQTMTIEASLRNLATGATKTITRKVTADAATDTFSGSALPKSGTYGIGTIPMVQFSQSIPVADRAAVNAKLHVTTSPTQIAGTWNWISSSTAAFRPTGFWPGNTSVEVHADIKNVVIRTSGTATYGARDEVGKFKTGRALVVNINAAKHKGDITINGIAVRKFGVSTGKAGYITRSGIKTLQDKHRIQRMTNVGVTNDEVYDLQVPYAIRMTESGEFIHGAPWNGNIGYANTSHGCTNLHLNDAKWLYDRMLYGDPVVTKGTSRKMETTNGPGALWNIPHAKWESLI